MNGKKARALRRMAQQATQGLPETNLRGVKHSKKDPETQQEIRFNVQAVHVNCTRRVYRDMKRAYKKMQRAGEVPAV